MQLVDRRDFASPASQNVSSPPSQNKRPRQASPRRPLTARSDYAAKVFGFATFGKVYGLIICLAGLLNLSQPALDALTHGPFGDNPVPVNLGLLSAGLAVGVAMHR